MPTVTFEGDSNIFPVEVKVDEQFFDSLTPANVVDEAEKTVATAPSFDHVEFHTFISDVTSFSVQVRQNNHPDNTEEDND